ncbi:MAG: NAD(P)H-hydrate epimerase [Candidatus Omnitrophica bacterium]|nr:NAD(P)H-hydrate epimerase [Candidatus Omnitrophota bacterium]
MPLITSEVHSAISMLVLNSKQIKRLDEVASKVYGISTLILMENAGREIARLADKILRKGKKILVVCGTGNNGGDGFVAARHLSNMGHSVRVVLVGSAKKLKSDPQINFVILKKMKIPVLELKGRSYRFQSLVQQSKIIIDAMFGIGLSRPVSGIYFDVISELNRSGRRILSIDIPSGIDSDSGKVLGIAVKAHATGTLAAMKPGLILADGRKHSGKIKVLDISIPRSLLK